MHHHVEVEGPRLRELLLVVAPHLLGDGRLAVHHLVVAEGQQVVLVAEVHHGEAQLVVVAAAEVGVRLEVLQRVVHPAHVPLVVKAQAALVHGLGGAGQVRGVLRDQEHAGVERLDARVHGLDEGDGLVVDAAGFVPLPIDDAADGVHAQAVKVVGTYPEVGAGLHEAARLAARVHEVVAAPLRDAHRLVGVLEEGRAVVVGQAIGVRGKVHGHNVQDAAYTRLVQGVHQLHELVRGAVAAGGGEEAGGLVAPRAVEGVLAQGHELHVVVAGLGQVVRERLGNLLVGVPVGRVVRGLVAGPLAPAAHVHLVYVHGLAGGVLAGGHPLLVVPGVGEVAHDGAVRGAELHLVAVGVGVVHVGTRMEDAVLVGIARLGDRNVQLPKVAVLHLVHGDGVAVQHALNLLGGWGKGTEGDAVPLDARTQVVLCVELATGVEVVGVHGSPHPCAAILVSLMLAATS